jgi:hypothetical protein
VTVEEPVIAPIARKHNVSDEAMLHAFSIPIRAEELDDGLVMLVGPDHAGNLFEVGNGGLRRRPSDRPCDASPTQVSKVKIMPRTVTEILDQADELAARFEAHDPDPDAISDAAALRAVRRAFQARAQAERQLADAVSVARAEGHSWAAIGAMVGTSGEAARQRYGRPAPKR